MNLIEKELIGMLESEVKTEADVGFVDLEAYINTQVTDPVLLAAGLELVEKLRVFVAAIPQV